MTKVMVALCHGIYLDNSHFGADVDYWSVNDVGDWLDSILLSQYKNIFNQNQIAGPILLDISLEDLDYMSITTLAHRKVGTVAPVPPSPPPLLLHPREREEG